MTLYKRCSYLWNFKNKGTETMLIININTNINIAVNNMILLLNFL